MDRNDFSKPLVYSQDITTLLDNDGGVIRAKSMCFYLFLTFFQSASIKNSKNRNFNFFSELGFAESADP